jgi:periplasmic copper chaperone A
LLCSPTLRRAISLGVAVALAFAVAGIAVAHVTVNPREAPAGGFARLDFRVSHGCDGSPTTAIRIQIPSGVVSVVPQNKPGWTVDLVTGPLEEPYDDHGQLVTDGVIEVAWTGGNLPDGLFEDFGLSVRLPDRAGETLYFPVLQECESGSYAWIQIPAEGEDAHDLAEPAPALRLVASDDGHGDSHDDGHSHSSHESGDAVEANQAVAAATGSDGTSTVAWLALGVAILGVAVGALGIGLALRKH